MRFIILVSIIFLPFFLSAQIVNIETQRLQSDTTGWLGTLGSNFLFEKNAVEILNINLNAHVEYKTKKSLYLFLANYNLLKGSGQTLSDNLFYHLRYNYKITKWLRWEVFTQLQQNSVTGIDLRLLAGTGPRFKLSGTKSLHFIQQPQECLNMKKKQPHQQFIIVIYAAAVMLLLHLSQQIMLSLSALFFISHSIIILMTTEF